MEDQINSLGKIAGSVSAIIALLALLLVNPIKNRLRARKAEKQAQADFRERVMQKLDSITDDIGDLQYERLSQAHDFYTSQGWCPTSKKVQLCNMHKSYRAKGRNHLSEHYEEDIMRLKDKPVSAET